MTDTIRIPTFVERDMPTREQIEQYLLSRPDQWQQNSETPIHFIATHPAPESKEWELFLYLGHDKTLGREYVTTRLEIIASVEGREVLAVYNDIMGLNRKRQDMILRLSDLATIEITSTWIEGTKGEALCESFKAIVMALFLFESGEPTND